MQIHALKRGMEVSLRSPNSLELVASSAVSNVDDKETGPDYVEVLVNYVMKKSTMLPRAQGKIKKMSSAQASCILWPRIHVKILQNFETLLTTSALDEVVTCYVHVVDECCHPITNCTPKNLEGT
jgi:hypothetical protein